ncbi:MAG: hypothetical protein HY327_08700 [Chloroflexi bacterium]|nr:hypothetical protein [Chloroflexota bacterium]
MNRKVGLEVVRINPALPDALRQMSALRPSVIIFDSGDKALGDFPGAAQLLRENPGMTILRLELESSNVTILSSEQQSVTNSEEIVDVIRKAIGRNGEKGTYPT